MPKRAKAHDPISQAFVAAVMAKLRISTPRELATVLGVAQTDKETQVGRWVRGESAPSFHYAMKLLTAAGWLKPEALRAYGQAAPPPATAEESEAALGRVASGAPRRAGRAGRQGS